MPLSQGIELRHLRYFLAVYEELHFGRAAERLHIAQPPLSQAIRKLETELGTRLLERTSRTVHPTAAGHAFAEEARKVMASFEFAVAEARRVGAGSPPIRVGWVTYLPTRRLRGFLKALGERDGNVRAEVSHLLGLEQVGRLRAGELDIGVFAHSEDYEGLDWVQLYPGETVKAFVPNGHRLASKAVVEPRDLWGETLVTYPRAVNPAFYDRFMAVLEQAGYRFARRHETNPDPRDAILAVATGLGVALGPASFEERSLVLDHGLVGIPTDPPVAYPETIVAWRADPPRQLSERLDLVREAAAEVFRAASPSGEGLAAT